MRRTLTLALVGLGLTLVGGAGRATDSASLVDSAAETGAPVAVSPGTASGSRTRDACPTFSWGTVPGAERYEVIVYLVGEENEEAKPVLLEAVSGSASSWTPSLERCLERGGRYAWSVRAWDGARASDWSSPSLFQVAAEPSRAELDRALEVVRLYIQGREQVETGGPRSVTADVVSATPTPATETTEAGAGQALFAPQPLAPAGTKMSIDGNVDADSFSGSGSQLTDLNSDKPCFSLDRRFEDCGNGTITDGATGLVYLKNSNCYGPQTYIVANALAALTKDGVCGLTDGSHRGDWRLPSVEEWETILKPSCATLPKLVGNGTPTTGCFSDNSGANEWIFVVNSNSSYWSSATVETLALSDSASVASFSTGDAASTISDKAGSNFFWLVREGR